MARRLEHLLIGLMVITVLFHLAFHVSPWINLAKDFNYEWAMIALFAFALSNGVLLIGWRNTLVFVVLGTTIGWSVEAYGIATGDVFGPYHYSDLLDPKLWTVPYVIPLAWFLVVYMAHVITNLMITRRPVQNNGKLYHLLLLSLVTGLIATAYDMAMDPTMSQVVKAWIWDGNGKYFGVFFKNYAGWVVTAFAIDFLYRLWQRRFPSSAITNRPRLIAAFVIGAYSVLALAYMTFGYPVATQLVTVFVMGIPILTAASAFMEWRALDDEI